MRVISYGGGVQSTALLVLAATGRIDFPLAVFANVGTDSEKPETTAYVDQVAAPYAAAHGVQLVTVSRPGPTLLQYHAANMAATGATPLPVKLTAAEDHAVTVGVGNRTCSVRWKAQPVAHWLKAHGATKTDPATLAIGFSTDELQRATTRRDRTYERRTFPLLDLGLSRTDCLQVIADAGLPVPGKSSCWFCPFHTLADWSQLRRDRPARFGAVVDLETATNVARAEHGKAPVRWANRPGSLADVITEADPTLPGLGPVQAGCDDGACWT